MAETASPTATPKRKRSDLVADMRLSASPPNHHAKTVFSFRPPSIQSALESDCQIEDGSRSPRSKVAQKLGDLAISESNEGHEGPKGTSAGSESESGGGVTAAAGIRHEIPIPPNSTRFDFNFNAGAAAAQVDMQSDRDDENAACMHKRAKTAELDVSNPESAADSETRETSNLETPTLPDHDRTYRLPPTSVDSTLGNIFDAPQSGKSYRSYPPINRLVDSTSRCRRRLGTPPLSSRRRGNTRSHLAKEGEVAIVDPVRAALTWSEDEITVYDPNDKDDDGTGINGIGFKPTAAVAHRRAQKRREQLAEYKKREESDARARRNQRRRGQLGGGSELARKHSIVRVHFSDAPPTTVMTT